MASSRSGWIAIDTEHAFAEKTAGRYRDQLIRRMGGRFALSAQWLELRNVGPACNRPCYVWPGILKAAASCSFKASLGRSKCCAHLPAKSIGLVDRSPVEFQNLRHVLGGYRRGYIRDKPTTRAHASPVRSTARWQSLLAARRVLGAPQLRDSLSSEQISRYSTGRPGSQTKCAQNCNHLVAELWPWGSTSPSLRKSRGQ